ncbi:hypothetical protein BD626DRAFT_156548 [Schizophyllum amplum]|uniref:Uncharacterized protein n=1 Tax=Schizophyllum amplum TaxID=97359 RepID=A0A550C340_9AGAR|nr:hypothetical protein BD626DRAFT_156548 [Auriculariopsis ampla]
MPALRVCLSWVCRVGVSCFPSPIQSSSLLTSGFNHHSPTSSFGLIGYPLAWNSCHQPSPPTVPPSEREPNAIHSTVSLYVSSSCIIASPYLSLCTVFRLWRISAS